MNEVFDIVSKLPYQHLVFTFFSIIIGFILIYIYTYTKNKCEECLEKAREMDRKRRMKDSLDAFKDSLSIYKTIYDELK